MGGVPAQPPSAHFTAEIDLRPEVDDDRWFVVDLFAATRAGDFAALGWTKQQVDTLLHGQFTAQTAGHLASHPGAEHSIILLDGDPVGRLVVDRGVESIDLVDICLAPYVQRHGVGSRLITGLQHEADARGVEVRLSVHVSNPARRLYDRLGFDASDVSDVSGASDRDRDRDRDEQYVKMRWRPPYVSVSTTTPVSTTTNISTASNVSHMSAHLQEALHE